ncbi:MAG: flavodoxin domain-containing protein [Deltaproteobacteria bacterium]|nr:flavodoxin domain-containing protein [Deltaproteobacteria bacterium]MBW2601454.1 flavodoxin domain-containing protein [Deltaproteobacteria bacterium]
MKKVLIAYYSRTGNTEQMAQYIAEGVRISGHEVELKGISAIKNEKEIQDYDAYMFGCPTYHRDMTNNMKTFLFLAQKARLEGKIGGSFGSYTHSGDAPKLIFDTMEYVFKMNMTELGSFNLKEHIVQTSEGMRACQDYGKAISQKLSE